MTISVRVKNIMTFGIAMKHDSQNNNRNLNSSHKMRRNAYDECHYSNK